MLHLLPPHFRTKYETMASYRKVNPSEKKAKTKQACRSWGACKVSGEESPDLRAARLTESEVGVVLINQAHEKFTSHISTAPHRLLQSAMQSHH